MKCPVCNNSYDVHYDHDLCYSCTKGQLIKSLEAKNAELENQLKLSNEFVDIWRDKAIELEKKLESVEMVHSNYVNVSCDLYSTLEKKLEIALSALSNWLSWEDEQIKQAGPYHGQRISKLINEGKQALAAIKDAE